MANSIDAMKPELWNKFGLALFWEKMVMLHRVSRQFKNELASEGDTVNYHKSAKRTVKRKGTSDIQRGDIDVENIPIVLNQHLYDSFELSDRDMSISFDTLVEETLEPSIKGIAFGFEKVLAYTAISGFLSNAIGRLGGLTNANCKGYGLQLNQFHNDNNAPHPRTTGLSSDAETIFLDADIFISAERVGDGGLALREALLGRKLGQDFIRGSAFPSIPASSVTVVNGIVDLTAGYAAGSTVIACDAITDPADGSYITFAESPYPYRIASATTTAITLATGLKDAITDGSAFSIVESGAINLSAGYVSSWEEPMVINGVTLAPAVGQLCAIGSAVYMVMEATTTSILFDRPLDALVANGAILNFGPAGSYNPSFVADAIAVVSRPLALPLAKNIDSAVGAHDGISMRTTIGYDMDAQANIVTIDLLMGCALTDSDLGTVLLG